MIDKLTGLLSVMCDICDVRDMELYGHPEVRRSVATQHEQHQQDEEIWRNLLDMTLCFNILLLIYLT